MSERASAAPAVAVKARVFDQPPAVIIGMHTINGLQTARLLARHGVPIIGISSNRRGAFSRTNACREVIEVDTRSDDLLPALLELGRSLSVKGVLYPCMDEVVVFVCKHQDALREFFHVPLPPLETLDTLIDKEKFARFAEANGLPVPQTVIVRGPGDVDLVADRLRFPCIVKPSSKHKALTVERVETVAAWKALYERCARTLPGVPLLVQEWIEGDDTHLYSCNGYFNADGEPLVTFVARKIRQWPPGAGSSSLGEEVRDDRVRDETLRLFGSLAFHGLCYLEMKKSATTGEYFIIEPNVGRPTTRGPIAEGGGVDLIYSSYCDAAGLPLPENRVQRYVGAKWVMLHADLRSAYHYWRNGQLSVGEWWSSLRGPKVFALLSRSDPLPFMLYVFQAAADHIKRRLARA